LKRKGHKEEQAVDRNEAGKIEQGNVSGCMEAEYTRERMSECDEQSCSACTCPSTTH
jgi:hypothetical protein